MMTYGGGVVLVVMVLCCCLPTFWVRRPGTFRSFFSPWAEGVVATIASSALIPAPYLQPGEHISPADNRSRRLACRFAYGQRSRTH